MYLQLLTLLWTNLQIQTNPRLRNWGWKNNQEGAGGVLTGSCREGGLEGAAAQAKIIKKFSFYSANNRGYFLPMTSRPWRWCWWKSRTLLVVPVANILQLPLLKITFFYFFFLFKCLTTSQILSADSADPRINHSIPNPCEKVQTLQPALPQ